MERLNIALVGAGRRGAGAHAPVLGALDDVFNFVAVCDATEERAQEVAARYGCNAYTSARDLVKNEALDIADVVVPGNAHHALSCFFSTHGIHHIVETPIAVTLPLADLMIETAKRHRVKLEVAENYYRQPLIRLKQEVIDSGAIGSVSRIYRIFEEGGYHGMSVLRIWAGADPTAVMGVSHTSPVVPIIDRKLRRHETEKLSIGYIEFANGVTALSAYSNVVHARSLGRGAFHCSQIDGTHGAIVGDEVHAVPADELLSGAQSTPALPQRITSERDGVEVLERLEVALPDRHIAWENPFRRYPLTEGQVEVADELLSIAAAVREDAEPAYGAHAARLDQEMDIAMLESGEKDRTTIPFPLQQTTQNEEEIHESFMEKYGCEPTDVDRLVDTFFYRG
jgi:predicted dehydrogenase